MLRSTDRRESGESDPSPLSTGSVVIEANEKYRYHFSKRNPPDAFLHNPNSAMTIIPPSCELRECRGCPSRKRCLSIIIDKNNLSDARLSNWNLIHLGMLILMISSYQKSQETQKSQYLSSALQAYLHNPSLHQWREQKESRWTITLCAFCVLGTIWILISFVSSLLPLRKSTKTTLPIALSLAWVSICIITAAIWQIMPTVLKKLSDYPQQGHRQLASNLRNALNAFPKEQQEASLARPLYNPSPPLRDAEMMLPWPTIPSTQANLTMVEMATPCTSSSTRLGHATPCSEVAADSGMPTQTSCVIIHSPESGTSEANRIAPTTPQHCYPSAARTNTYSPPFSCLQGVKEPHTTQSLPATAQSSPATGSQVYRTVSYSP